MDNFLLDRFDEIIASPRVPREVGPLIGHSRGGEPIRGFRFGTGPYAVSLLGGCHADEPVGPRLLRHMVSYLANLQSDDPLLAEYEWWIVPHINPDGEHRNDIWADENAVSYDIGRYLQSAIRELPGDDIEFGFPRDNTDMEARPENRSVFEWWQTCEKPFLLHTSLHGTRFTAGPWFLIDAAWQDRCSELKWACKNRVEELGDVLHDVERHGEKGFVRIERGFATRPDSRSMIEHFEGLEDFVTAGRFRPSSMEAIRRLGHDALTLVSEMPLFITPGVGETLGPPDPVAEQGKERIARWQAQVHTGGDPIVLTKKATAAGITSMPIRDQMDLQWTFVRAGLELLRVR